MAGKKRKKKVKQPWGKPPLRPPTLSAGEVRGDLRVIEYVASKGGKRQVLVEDVKTGKRFTVRASNVVSGNTTSDGRIKVARYKEHMGQYIHTDIDHLGRDLVAGSRSWLGVDQNGKPIEKAEPKKPAPVQAVPSTPAPTFKELVAHGLVFEESGYWTELGQAWKAEGRPDLATWKPA